MFKKYKNLHISEKRNLINIIFWKLGLYRKNKSFYNPGFKNEILNKKHVEANFDLKKPFFSWINHSSFLVNINGTTILTDPIFSDICSPISFLGPKRLHPPGLKLDDLKNVDFVLISHDHYDHLDKFTVKMLYKKFPNVTFITPLGIKKWFLKKKIMSIKELSWWDSLTFNLKDNHFLKITAVPSQHFSGRGCFFYKSLWCGFVVEYFTSEKKCLKKFYFTGDTGYNEYDFKDIGKKWNDIDLSFIPIGSYLPKKLMKPIHINPTEAVNIHKEVNSKLSIGMHWKTFQLSDEIAEQPPYDLFMATEKEKIDNFVVVDPGDHINW